MEVSRTSGRVNYYLCYEAQVFYDLLCPFSFRVVVLSFQPYGPDEWYRASLWARSHNPDPAMEQPYAPMKGAISSGLQDSPGVQKFEWGTSR